MNGSTNPLAKHFRQPILYAKLPSQGRWYPEGSVDIPVNGEVPIYAMTARDEITMKTPDALLNGSSTAHVVESCCPSIKNAWKMPLVDLDTILLSIRLATYGKAMEFTAACPHCNSKVEKALDLTFILEKIRLGDWDTPIIINDLKISLRPQTFEEYNKNNMLNFEEQRLIQIASDDNLADDEKTKQFDKIFQSVIETGIDQVSRSIASIELPDGTIVVEHAFIKEFLNNCDSSVWTAIKAQLEEIQKSNKYNEVNLTCENADCAKEFVAPFIFEQTNFFG